MSNGTNYASSLYELWVLRLDNEFEIGGTGNAPMEHLADFCKDLLVLRWEFHLGYVPGSL